VKIDTRGVSRDGIRSNKDSRKREEKTERSSWRGSRDEGREAYQDVRRKMKE
jgi:hypothetical protein